jgi:glycosyltransferase involved in cell wall biosynthesis
MKNVDTTGLAQLGVKLPRICWLIETFYPVINDGTAIHNYQLSRSLSAKGVELLVITRQTDPPSSALERIGNMVVKRIPPGGLMKGKGWRALGPQLLFLLRVFFLLLQKRSQYDIVVVSGFKMLSVPAVLARVLAQKKCVIKAESPMELREDISSESLRKMGLSQDFLGVRLFRKLRNSLVNKADCFIAISGEIGQEFVGLGMNQQQVKTIPNGIDTNKFSPVSSEQKHRIRQRLSLPKDRTIFSFTGRLAASKGVLLLIRAWKDLVQQYPGIHLVVVGSGTTKLSFDSCEEELVNYIKTHSLGATVTLTGQVDNVQAYLQASDAFVFPSDYEGFGLAIVEALACALPAVITRVGVANEYIQDYQNGILINPKDQAGLTEAMSWLLNHRNLWSSIGSNARKGISSKYSIEVVAEKYLDVFRELVKTDKTVMSAYSYKDEPA